MGSLQDQLLKAGLTTEHKLKVAKSEKRKQTKKKKKGATSDQTDLQKHIQQTKAEQAQKQAELNQQKLQEQQEKENIARAKQILEHHNQDEITGKVTFNFTFEGKIKELVKGTLAICYLEGKFYVLPDEPARKIAEINESYIVLHAEPESKEKDEDDPYADFEIPDDLMW
jgi:uncharacterized protein YaiL (DUF2058 family)